MEWKLTIDGMHCGGCAAGVAAALEKLRQVERASVDFAEGTAIVTGNAKLDVEKMKKAVKNAGFVVTAVDVMES